MTKPLENYTREELIEAINSLKRQKKFGLVWEDKPEKVADECKEKLPILIEDEERKIEKAPNEKTNIIIEGDNYHALSVLNYTHANKVDVIYIDPPYNTGNTSWRYNNRYVDRDDAFRHSKFISFLYKRLALAKNLLSEGGILAVAIDDYEMQNVRLILDDIFGEDNRLSTCVVLHNPGGRQDDKFFATAHEYCLYYTNNKQKSVIHRLALTDAKRAQFKNTDEYGAYKLRSFIRTGAHSRPNERPGLHYPIFIDTASKELFVEKPSDKNCIELWPEDSQGNPRVWRWGKKTLIDKKEKYIECKEKNGVYSLYVKERESDNEGLKPKTIWDNSGYASASAINTLKNIFGETSTTVFDYPKSPTLMHDTLKIISNPDSIILDFFAGSGTTGQAVLELNKEDGGYRQFILCTNNENKIAEEVTYPRMKTVITGKRNDGSEYSKGLPANLRYFKTSFIDKSETKDKLRRELCPACEDMIRIREGAFEKIIDDDMLKVYKNKRGLTAIIYDRFDISNYIEKIESLKTDTPVHLYLFSYDKNNRMDEIPKNVKHIYENQPIPEGVLEVYKKIFK